MTSAALAMALALAATGGEAPGPEAAGLPTLPEETVVVGTRSPRPAASLPTTVIVVPGEDVARSASPTVDGALRSVPSVATFRRSTSAVADPSSQGLSLRGVGPSAVSRALLLDDGVPLNDPFGGWIAWRAIPRLGLSRVEIAPGGASALYGSFALGGVVALVPRPAARAAVQAEATAGSHGAVGLAARGEHRAGALSGALEAEALRTAATPVVAPAARGAVDGDASARSATVSLRGAAGVGAGTVVRAGAGFFDEAQDGGTRFTGAGLRAWTGRAGVEREGPGGRVQLLLYGAARRFTQDRARIPADRSSEDLAAQQEVPSTDLGGTLLAALSRAGDHSLSAGLDLRRVAGESDEKLFPVTVGPTTAVAREGGGAQWTGGAFVQDAWAPSPALEVAGALRADLWRAEDGHVARTLGDGSAAEERFAARTRTVLSPRVAVRYTPAPPVTLRASAYRAFRAPTLNELYRPFQVGTVLTASNPSLGAEVLTGVEAGPELSLPGAARLRAAGFLSVLDAPIVTVTLPAPLEDGATRRRENLGRAVIRGVETEIAWRGAGGLSALAGWTLADARVDAAPGRPDLVGKALPHDPLHRLTARAGLDRPRLLSAVVEVRWTSRAWEDDLNTLHLPGYAVVDVTVSRVVGAGFELFAAVENALDRRYLVGRAGVDTIGAPRLVRGGVRVRAGG